MFKIKIVVSILIFSILLIATSIIKNQTREIEKNILSLNDVIHLKEKDLNESQLDYSYLTSPILIDQQVKRLDIVQYLPMEHSKIFLSISSFLNLQNKLANQGSQNEKKKKQKF
tara:strand:- start:261 stop:602 length:342 start_codon:yes stop_codon:yes gene_type:complete